ncbi:hypothetical protein ASG19_03985 [Rhizobium sp. Leaf306]|uniref:cellulose biosynthesis cyclic di-GMP-binding regulatory protein BcsB n=1 Tax=Rhizobium sp. Leaf306 TaxID=1736330 RepID=UPI000714037A|nr:cellulose biosynthesis cyclic di-GMP-binding regulatory protein BcsB [Rhizobium sp. Leaf306]KQQ38232.1 hypothetical protein ASG19_03985 [Rhizobium sp. Leaf306]
MIINTRFPRLLFVAAMLASTGALSVSSLAQQPGQSPATASSPFDMGPERSRQGVTPTAPPSPQTPAPAPVPQVQRPIPAAPKTPAAPAPAATASPSPVTAPAPQAAAKASTETARRYLIPAPSLRLNGEVQQRSWSVYLTEEQAATGAKLHLTYQNSIVVAPEASRLSVTINDVEIYGDKIASPDQPFERVLDIPPGVLKAGGNMVRFAANQRHRTDCTVESTFELWTDIDPKRTFLAFDDERSDRFNRLDDVRAVGVDGSGKTRFRLIVPALDQLGATDVLMRLAQGLSLVGGMPNQSFSFQKTITPDLRPGELAVFVGTPDELRPILPNLAAAASSAAVASFTDYPGHGSSALVLSGPSWPALQGLIDSFVASTDGGSIQRRDTLATSSWRGIDTPFLFAEKSIDFNSLGVSSEEFSGRLYRTEFTIGVPADFYANAYGEARILLDAAYVSEVLPGSHIDVFVNGNIASTVPITSDGGAILRHLPIKLTLRHFKPGVNTITLEAALLTASDKACAPGATANEGTRFALFGTSQFEMPDFARIARVPNLGATSGTGFPYSTGTESVPLFLGRIDEKTLGSAATFLGKIATASHRAIPVSVTISTARIAGRNALFVGAISEFPANILTDLGIEQKSRGSWGENSDHVPADRASLTLQDWQDRNGNNFFGRQLSSVADWAKRNFDLSAPMLRFAPAGDAIYVPPKTAGMIIAQENDPTQTGTWTAVIGATGDELSAGMEAFSAREAWNQLDGRVSVHDVSEADPVIVPVNWFHFTPTANFSLSNARLIATNWLSDNIMSYGLLLVASAILVGLATGGLLTRLGRK